jgi:peptidoglycan/LPS O-acetylase OafA/YrhL
MAKEHSFRYRTDIDGLRAIAVSAVVLFHAGVPGFGGGYTGVDVFFVISGYTPFTSQPENPLD